MGYQVLARKYRPQRFSDVAGQDHVTRTMMNALTQGRIAHGYIFSGHRGIGKTTIARILAMALNCRTAIGGVERSSAEPCGVCESCTEVRAGNAVDVIEIDAATNRGIDEIRELRDAARYRPARDRYKIYILDEAHQITDAAFNALLKTLEEPPDHVIFMMATTQPEDIPQTIRSRCQHFSFHAVKFDDILLQLRTIAAEERVTADDEALALLAEAGDGSMRDALSIMDQAIASASVQDGQARLDVGRIRELMGSVPNTVFERLLEAIGENQSAPVIEEANRLLNAGNSASQLARQFVRYLRNVLMARIAGERSELLQLSPDERARAGRSALLFSEEDLTRFLGVMLRTFDELNYRQEPRFHLELGLLKLVHLQRLLPVEQLLSQLGGAAVGPRVGEGALPGGDNSRTQSHDGGRVGLPAPRTATGPGGGDAAGAPAPSREELGRAAQSPVARPAEPATAPSGSPHGLAAFSPFEADSRRKGAERSPVGPSLKVEPSVIVAPLTGAKHGIALAPLPRTANGESLIQPGIVPDIEPGIVPGIVPVPAVAPESAAALPLKVEAHSASLDPGNAGDEDALAGDFFEMPKLSANGLHSKPSSAPPSAAQAAHAGLEADAGPDGSGKAVPAGDTFWAGSFAEAGKPEGADSDRDLDQVRERVVSTLEEAGHNTAAALVGNGEWHEEGEAILVKVAAKKTMLGLTMNSEAERICRETMRLLAGGGRPRPLSFMPGEAGPVAGTPRRSVQTGASPAGSVQARAMENPLVKQAQELFGAEVRSVVDLRDK